MFGCFYFVTHQSLLIIIYNKYKKEVIKLEKENPDMEQFMKKKEKYCSAKIKTLLFDKFLTKIEHKKKGIQTLTKFFGPSV